MCQEGNPGGVREPDGRVGSHGGRKERPKAEKVFSAKLRHFTFLV